MLCIYTKIIWKDTFENIYLPLGNTIEAARNLEVLVSRTGAFLQVAKFLELSFSSSLDTILPLFSVVRLRCFFSTNRSKLYIFCPKFEDIKHMKISI